MERDSKKGSVIDPFKLPDTEIAIIGYWVRDEDDKSTNEWRCYYYFEVENPLKREIRRSERGKD